MGIQGLLPLLKSIHRPTELKKYAGETFGVDGYGWLHRGAIACAIELAQGKPTRKYVDFAMHRVRMFKYFGVTPYLVFDGDFLPSKAKTEASREKRREESMKAGIELLKAGKASKAHTELQKAIDVTPEMARHLIEELKKAGVPYVVAPYEADAQLVYLEQQGIIGGIVSEDSDLLVFGAKRLLTKLDQHGQCIEINRKDFCAVREISLTGWTDNEFRHMAILSGCDYLAPVGGVGLKVAYRLLRKHKTPEKVIRMLRFEGKQRVPEDYLEEFKKAELTFLHQRVFCPKAQDIVFLTNPGPSVDVSEMPFIGAPVDTELARAVAVGDFNPITKKRIVLPPSPGKRRISQITAPVSVPARSLGKPINEYFADKRRIPLGEMDPNCFNINTERNGGSTAAEPRPIVFPLPRPYVEGADATASGPTRRYTSIEGAMRRRSEPVSNLLATFDTQSSQHRRRTAGPAIQIYQDPSPATRPPKKARLCEDSPLADSTEETPEKSRFFSSKKKPKSAKKEFDSILMSDDSVDEAFRNLPECEPRRANPTPSRSRTEITVYEECTAEDLIEDSLPPMPHAEEHDNAVGDEIEVPVSSPLEEKPVLKANSRKALTVKPLGELSQGLAYDTARAQTRIVHGLPTPSSSASSSTATPKTAAPNYSRTPMMTPLQRLGARAMQRGKPASSIPKLATSTGVGRRTGSLSVNPALVPLPKVDLAEVEALNTVVGSEDQIIPSSDGELEQDEEPQTANRPLNLSRFMYA